MKVAVIWISGDDDAVVEGAFRTYDANPFRYPSPVEWVAQALQFGAQQDMSLPIEEESPGAKGFEVRVEGPDTWSAAYDQPERPSDDARE